MKGRCGPDSRDDPLEMLQAKSPVEEPRQQAVVEGHVFPRRLDELRDDAVHDFPTQIFRDFAEIEWKLSGFHFIIFLVFVFFDRFFDGGGGSGGIFPVVTHRRFVVVVVVVVPNGMPRRHCLSLHRRRRRHGDRNKLIIFFFFFFVVVITVLVTVVTISVVVVGAMTTTTPMMNRRRHRRLRRWMTPQPVGSGEDTSGNNVQRHRFQRRHLRREPP